MAVLSEAGIWRVGKESTRKRRNENQTRGDISGTAYVHLYSTIVIQKTTKKEHKRGNMENIYSIQIIIGNLIYISTVSLGKLCLNYIQIFNIKTYMESNLNTFRRYVGIFQRFLV